MVADALLSRLTKVRRTGAGRWLACCPAHADKSPSLSVRELADGRVLAYCFGGCSVAEVLGAVGLDFEALFPERLPVGTHSRPRERLPFSAHDALTAIAKEATLVVTLANDLAAGNRLDEALKALLLRAAARITAALDVCGGAR